MPVTVKAQICACITVPSDPPQNIEIREGDIVQDLIYRKNGVESSISGAVRVIDGTTSKVNVNQSCPPEPYFHKLATVSGFIIDCSGTYDADLVKISVNDIVSIGSVTSPDEIDKPDDSGTVSITTGPQFKAIDDVMNDVPEGTTIKLAAGKYTKFLNINRSISFVGPNDAAQNTIMTADVEQAAVINNIININNPDVDVEFRGITFTENARINVLKAKSFKLINCRIEGIIPDVKITCPIHVDHGDGSMLIKIEGNYFGDNVKTDTNSCYNLINFNTKILDGTSVSNNFFATNCCTHNQINIYNVEEAATITINGNNAIKSANMIRFAVKGETACVVNCNGNKYGETDPTEDGRYAGLMIIQPYNKDTTTFANCTININDTVHADNYQLAYLYYGVADTEITKELEPKVVIDGIAYALPIVH